MQRILMVCALVLAGCIDVHPELPVEKELCDGIHDGTDEPTLGDACDGLDEDMCPKGRIECTAGQLVCAGDSAAGPETCNDRDDDCDGEVDEGFDFAADLENCGFCGNACTNANGTTSCTAGACVPVCVTGSVDCNENENDGCEVFRDRNPVCTMATEMGSVVGDLGGMSVELIGTDEAYFDVAVVEQSTVNAPVTATVTLESPPGANYDLFVTCAACGGAIMGSSTNPAGMIDTVNYRREDTDFSSDTRTLHIEVRSISATTCGPTYRLSVTGATTVATATCN